MLANRILVIRSKNHMHRISRFFSRKIFLQRVVSTPFPPGPLTVKKDSTFSFKFNGRWECTVTLNKDAYLHGFRKNLKVVNTLVFICTWLGYRCASQFYDLLVSLFRTVWYELLAGMWPFDSQPWEFIIWQIGKGFKQPLSKLDISREAKVRQII